MLSRVAEATYWMSRYLERAENVARFISVNQNLTLGLAAGMRTQWSPLIHASGDLELFEEHYASFSEANVLEFLLFDLRNLNSIRSCLRCARENARTIRETLTVPMWQAINEFYLMVEEAAAKQAETLRQPQRFLDKVVERNHLTIGCTDVTLSHGEAYHFSNLGRHIERADKTSRIIDMKYYTLLRKAEDVGTSVDIVQWTALLASTSALTMYRRRFGTISPERVTDFLLLDRWFPRSILYCVSAADSSLHWISECPMDQYSSQSEKLLGRLRSDLDFLSVGDVFAEGSHEFVDRFQRQLNDIGKQIHADYFDAVLADARAGQWQRQ